MFEYYLIFVSTISQKIIPKLENMVDLIAYTLLFLFSKSGTKNNEDIFLFDNLLFPLDQNKKKKPIQLWELIVDNIIKVLKILLVSLIKKSIK